MINTVEFDPPDSVLKICHGFYGFVDIKNVSVNGEKPEANGGSRRNRPKTAAITLHRSEVANKIRQLSAQRRVKSARAGQRRQQQSTAAAPVTRYLRYRHKQNQNCGDPSLADFVL